LEIAVSNYREEKTKIQTVSKAVGKLLDKCDDTFLGTAFVWAYDPNDLTKKVICCCLHQLDQRTSVKFCWMDQNYENTQICKLGWPGEGHDVAFLLPANPDILPSGVCVTDVKKPLPFPSPVLVIGYPGLGSSYNAEKFPGNLETKRHSIGYVHNTNCPENEIRYIANTLPGSCGSPIVCLGYDLTEYGLSSKEKFGEVFGMHNLGSSAANGGITVSVLRTVLTNWLETNNKPTARQPVDIPNQVNKPTARQPVNIINQVNKPTVRQPVNKANLVNKPTVNIINQVNKLKARQPVNIINQVNKPTVRQPVSYSSSSSSSSSSSQPNSECWLEKLFKWISRRLMELFCCCPCVRMIRH